MLFFSASDDGFMKAFERRVVKVRGAFHGHEMNKIPGQSCDQYAISFSEAA